MPKNTKSENTRTSPVDVAPPNSNGIMAAWDGLYHIFDARYESIDYAEDGLVIKGLTFEAGTPDSIVDDVNRRDRRVPFYPTIAWVNGQEPAPMTDPKKMQAWLVNFFRGSVDENSTRSPKYARDAVARYKATLGITSKRGPKPRSINLKNLSTVDVSTLRSAKVNQADLEHLIAVAQEALASANGSEELSTETATEVATA